MPLSEVFRGLLKAGVGYTAGQLAGKQRAQELAAENWERQVQMQELARQQALSQSALATEAQQRALAQTAEQRQAQTFGVTFPTLTLEQQLTRGILPTRFTGEEARIGAETSQNILAQRTAQEALPLVQPRAQAEQVGLQYQTDTYNALMAAGVPESQAAQQAAQAMFARQQALSGIALQPQVEATDAATLKLKQETLNRAIQQADVELDPRQQNAALQAVLFNTPPEEIEDPEVKTVVQMYHAALKMPPPPVDITIPLPAPFGPLGQPSEIARRKEEATIAATLAGPEIARGELDVSRGRLDLAREELRQQGKIAESNQALQWAQFNYLKSQESWKRMTEQQRWELQAKADLLGTMSLSNMVQQPEVVLETAKAMRNRNLLSKEGYLEIEALLKSGDATKLSVAGTRLQTFLNMYYGAAGAQTGGMTIPGGGATPLAPVPQG